MIRRISWSLALLILPILGQDVAQGQSHSEPKLMPGSTVSTVRAVTCNTAEQLEAILSAYSVDYHTGRAVFEDYRQERSYDAAAGRQAPVCDEVWFDAILPVRTISNRPYSVQFADGSRHPRYVIEIKPLYPDGTVAEASYFISSRWQVLTLETAL